MDKHKVEKIEKQYRNGEEIKRKNIIYKDNIIGLRKANIVYNLSFDEKIIFAECYNNIFYFIEEILNVKLREYQVNLINHVINNNYSILLNSREVGIDRLLCYLYLHNILFNKKQNISLFFDKRNRIQEYNNILKELYKKIPFFLQIGILNWNMKKIILENGNSITFKIATKSIDIDETTLCVFDDFSYYIEDVVDSIMVKLFEESVNVIIPSEPNGYNKFMNLVHDSEREQDDPSKNVFNTFRTYWWQVPNRDEEWKNTKIKQVGEKFFREKYDLIF